MYLLISPIPFQNQDYGSFWKVSEVIKAVTKSQQLNYKTPLFSGPSSHPSGLLTLKGSAFGWSWIASPSLQSLPFAVKIKAEFLFETKPCAPLHVPYVLRSLIFGQSSPTPTPTLLSVPFNHKDTAQHLSSSLPFSPATLLSPHPQSGHSSSPEYLFSFLFKYPLLANCVGLPS